LFPIGKSLFIAIARLFIVNKVRVIKAQRYTVAEIWEIKGAFRKRVNKGLMLWGFVRIVCENIWLLLG
jgi:hypothetical protein